MWDEKVPRIEITTLRCFRHRHGSVKDVKDQIQIKYSDIRGSAVGQNHIAARDRLWLPVRGLGREGAHSEKRYMQVGEESRMNDRYVSHGYALTWPKITNR